MSPVPVPPLPGFAGLQFDSCAITDTLIVLAAHVSTPTAACPACGAASARVHSTYDRHPRDLPWQGLPVRVTLRVRRFFCPSLGCRKKTFAEQFPDFTLRYAHRTRALNTALLTLGLKLGGEAGSALGQALGISGSAATILRRVHRFSPPPPPAPRVVGIDEWAIRKGHRYGSILVDLERHQPIALLPEHAPEPIAAWFQQHPTIEVIARDRASIYAEALGKGAPQAVQVADRWHLMQNLGTAVQEMLVHHTAALREVAQQLTAERMPPVVELAPPCHLPPLEPPGHIVGPIEVRQYQFAEAKRLHAQGWSYRRIAQELQLNRRTVLRYVQAEQLPRRVLPQSTSSVTPYLAYVREQWEAGCQQGTKLLADLQARGYSGSLSSVYRALKAFRRGDGRRLVEGAAVERVGVRSPRQAMWLLLSEEQELSDEDMAYRTALCAHNATIGQAAALGQRFLAIVRERRAENLEGWLAEAESSGIKELRGLAKSLRRDHAAVSMAVASEWSNGQTEGHVNRLKMIKRTMFGRAGFTLLRNRVLDTSARKRDHGT